MEPDLTSRLGRRVVAAAEKSVAHRGAVSVLDVLVGIGWLAQNTVDAWHQGRVDPLQQAIQASPDTQAAAVELLRVWAQGQGMSAETGSYVAASRDRRELRFTRDGGAVAEAAFRTHWVSPEATGAQRKREEKRRSTAPDLVVLESSRDWACASCGEEDGALLTMEGEQPHCLVCADMDHLVLLPAGDAALTRRTKKASGLSAVVMRWVPSRKRYRRIGILVEEQALEQAEEQCLADADVRARRRERDAVRRAEQDVGFQERFAAEIGRFFPGCPAERAERIARHTGMRGSGRVGRSAAGRELDEAALRRAVVASVRHEDTDYDDLLMSGVPREEARDKVADDIDRVLASWSP